MPQNLEFLPSAAPSRRFFCRILVTGIALAGGCAHAANNPPVLISPSVVTTVSSAEDLPVAPVAAPTGVPVTFQLPETGPLPRTYTVTLAVVDPKNPNWIIGQFVCAQPYTVTAENHGHFTANWNGLDDNFMPVPPGTYAVKGIYMPADKWRVDGEYHSITPLFHSGYSTWLPTPDQYNVPEPFGGDPVGSPIRDVDVGPDGKAVFYWQYLENGKNTPVIDLTKPLGLGQFVRAYNSGGTAGGDSTCTDGTTVWEESGVFVENVFRPDNQPFGTDSSPWSNHVVRPLGVVKALACYRDPAAQKTYVYIAQGGRIVQTKDWPFYHADETNPVDAITVHEGDGGKQLASVPVSHPLGLVARSGTLYVLHETADGKYEVVSSTLQAGVPSAPWRTEFDLPDGVVPFDLERDSHGRFYVSVPAANKVLQFDANGHQTLAYGRLDAQKPGAYDPETFMDPQKLAIWTDAAGADHLLVVEMAGPNRVSQWSADGKLERQFEILQVAANGGYSVDPDHPENLYIGGQEGWLTRFKLDYANHTWTTDAVWPHLDGVPDPGLEHMKFVRLNGHEYLIFPGRQMAVYIHDGDRWRLSAALISKRVGNKGSSYLWHDTDGSGVIKDEQLQDITADLPGAVIRYQGAQAMDDLSIYSLNQNGPDVWRLTPTSFTAAGDPIYTKWEKVLTDPIFTARAAGTADALHGGNELTNTYNSDWGEAELAPGGDVYVMARGGYSFSANQGAQEKLSRYVSDGHGGYIIKWRTGQAVLEGNAARGQIYGAIHLPAPINGIIPVIDQSRAGVVLYNTDGLYVDTLFPDGRVHRPDEVGVYALPGEFFAGDVYANREDGKIYAALGKYTAMLYEVQGWSTTQNPVHPLTQVQNSVTITGSQMASPSDVALFVRGGAGAARLAQVEPAIGGANLDGTLTGWENSLPVTITGAPNQTVEVRALYDPDHLYLRWHLRVPAALDVKPLGQLERMFTHDRLADTMSFYLQGDPNAPAAKGVAGRPGDARFIFGLAGDSTADAKPVALGLYTTWSGPEKANPFTYQTPVGKVQYANVGPIPGVQLNAVMDADGKGYVLTAAIPRAAIPLLPSIDGSYKTFANFEATFGGHGKIWWSNADGSASSETFDEPTEARLYPGSWAPIRFTALGNGLMVRRWQLCGPFGGPGAEKFDRDPSGAMKDDTQKFFNAATYPPDSGNVDLKAVYQGDMVTGYWPARDVHWKPAQVADLDTRVILGDGAQVWYGATWIHVPADTNLNFEFQGHPMTLIRYWLDNAEIFHGHDFDTQTQAVPLSAGWHQVEFRAYGWGYAPQRAGLVLKGSAAALWTVSLSDTPPAN